MEGGMPQRRCRILFVCLGNICRSPAAEEVMRALLREAHLDGRVEVDSAGISSYHRGDLPDARMRRHAARRGYSLTHRSRPVCTDDFFRFDLIIGMDDGNMDALKDLSPSLEADAKLHRMCEYCVDKAVDAVPDPYYGGAAGFEDVLDILEDACRGLLARIESGMDANSVENRYVSR